MIGMTLGHEPNASDAMNNSGLWMTRTTTTHKLRPLDTMNSSGLLLT